MTPFIRSLSIQGFRNLADVQLTLKPLNVLAGGNGTGKSALLQFFEMLSFVSRPEKFREYVFRHGGGNAQCFMGGAVTPVITASVIVTTDAGDCEYSLKLRYIPDDDHLVADESRWRFLPATAPVDQERSEKMLQQLGSRYGGFWESCPIFHFCRSAAEAAVNKRWDIGDSARLRSDGANLAPVLLALRENDLLRYRYIVRQIQREFPDFGGFVLEDEYGRVLLHWKHRFSDQVIGPYLTSDGTRRFFFPGDASESSRRPVAAVADDRGTGNRFASACGGTHRGDDAAGIVRTAGVGGDAVAGAHGCCDPGRCHFHDGVPGRRAVCTSVPGGLAALARRRLHTVGSVVKPPGRMEL